MICKVDLQGQPAASGVETCKTAVPAGGVKDRSSVQSHEGSYQEAKGSMLETFRHSKSIANTRAALQKHSEASFFPILSHPGHQPKGWCHPHSGWDFQLQ